MSLADRRKNAADGLFMLGMCTVTVTFLLLGDFHPEQKHLFPPFGGWRKAKVQQFTSKRPDCWFWAWVISLAITFNQVHFLHSIKVLPLGKKYIFFFIREEEKLLVFCNVLEHRIWINEWRLIWPQPRKRDDGKWQQKGACLLVAERAFSEKAPHHTILRYLHRGIRWMDAYWCQYWEECQAQRPFLITSKLLNKVTTWCTNQVVANL